MQLRSLYSKLEVIFVGLVILISANLMAQGDLPSKEDILSRKFSELQKLVYLTEHREKYRKELSPLLYDQKLAAIYSNYGKYEEAIEEDHGSDNSIKKLVASKFILNSDYIVRDAIEVIDSLADSFNVIIINEVHHMPQTRYLTLKLLGRLKRKGFNYLALEALKNDTINLTKIPLKTYLTYPEPIFGEILTTALKLNYKIVKYEPDPNTSNREIDQAKNIYNQVLKDNPKAKLIIHCGYSHASENLMSKKRWMASYLKELYNIDPLTIDQTINLYQGINLFDRFLDKYVNRYKVSCIQMGKGSFFRIPSFNDSTVLYDLQIYYAKPKYLDGRATWLRGIKQRKGISLSKYIKYLSPPYSISAYLESDNNEVIPKDQIVVTSEKDKVILYLDKGRYNVFISDKSNNNLKRFLLTVK